MILEGSVSYDQRPNANALSRGLKNSMNANSRMYLRSMNPFDTSPAYVSEKDFNQMQLDALRQAVINREAYLKNNKGTRNITYDDYGPSKLVNKPIFAPAIKDIDTIIRFQNSKDPVWDMQTAIGSADYMIDPYGKVTIEDRY